MSVHMYRDLEALKKMILSLGALVEETANKSIVALIEREPDMLPSILEDDDKIDDMELQVEEQCLKILALHQPVASDLRYVVTILKVNNDLERIGDIATNISKRAKFLAERKPLQMPNELQEMSKTVQIMLRNCIEALVNKDAELARKVRLMDDDVDEKFASMRDVLNKYMLEEPDMVERASHTFSALYQLERMADHTTNIAEDIIFMVEAKIVRHLREE